MMHAEMAITQKAFVGTLIVEMAVDTAWKHVDFST